MVLLLSNTSKLLVAWDGPHKVLERCGKVEYLVDLPRGPKVYHANTLKKYYRHVQINQPYILDETSSPSELEDVGKTFCITEYSCGLPDIQVITSKTPDNSKPSINPNLFGVSRQT